MSPFKWNKNQWVALAVFTIIGASIGAIVGYIVYATGSGSNGASSFERWLERGIDRGYAIPWLIYGGVVAYALAYCKKLFSLPE